MKKLLFATTATIGILATGVTANTQLEAAKTQSNTTTQQQGVDQTSTVHDRFIKAGGTEAMWQNIVLPESGGDPNAVSPQGYKGLGQTKEAWGTGTVEEQTKGMINYAEERYGSIDAAVQFRIANGWW
ncbi:hypothetical protein [Staphylococcus massiliensis]|uniref:SceA protein n=1 Tax=Staphylococcus massiliensis S46 TaxID=1229783 RepID=K9AZ79_9STAP|nr:hypothetical protein [Staphylococcus massiliensis]EKU46815.1 hypothetical protein C273_08926 [Staphylococcus massiliensis S46]POA01709.1 hypothetical protein CD133_00940 [Staphylococcus massiliensis CCUG 55927]